MIFFFFFCDVFSDDPFQVKDIPDATTSCEEEPSIKHRLRNSTKQQTIKENNKEKKQVEKKRKDKNKSISKSKNKNKREKRKFESDSSDTNMISNKHNNNNTDDDSDKTDEESQFTQLVKDTGKANKPKQKSRTIPRNCSLDELNDDVLNDIDNMNREDFMNKHGYNPCERIVKQMKIVDELKKNEHRNNNELSVSKQVTKETMNQIVNMASNGDDDTSQITIESDDISTNDKTSDEKEKDKNENEDIDIGNKNVQECQKMDDSEEKCDNNDNVSSENDLNLLDSIQQRYQQALSYKFNIDTIQNEIDKMDILILDVRLPCMSSLEESSAAVLDAANHLAMSVCHLKHLLTKEKTSLNIVCIENAWKMFLSSTKILIDIFSETYKNMHKKKDDSNHSQEIQDEASNAFEKRANKVNERKAEPKQLPQRVVSDKDIEQVIDSVVSNASKEQLKDRSVMNAMLQNEINNRLSDFNIENGIECNFATISRYNGDPCIGWGPARGSDNYGDVNHLEPYSMQQRNNDCKNNGHNFNNYNNNNDNSKEKEKESRVKKLVQENDINIANVGDNNNNSSGAIDEKLNENDKKNKEKSKTVDNNNKDDIEMNQQSNNDVLIQNKKRINKNKGIKKNKKEKTLSGKAQETDGWNCIKCTFLNHKFLRTCEMCQTKKCIFDESGSDNSSNSSSDSSSDSSTSDSSNDDSISNETSNKKNDNDSKMESISDDEYGVSIAKHRMTRKSAKSTKSKRKGSSKNVAKQTGELKIKINNKAETISINNEKITVAEIEKDYRVLSVKIKRHDIINGRKKNKDGIVSRPNKVYNTAEILFVYSRLREFEEVMTKQNRLYRNGKISGNQFNAISRIINIGRSGKSIQTHFNDWASVEFKEDVIGKLFCNLQNRIGSNTDSKSNTTS